MLHKEKQYFKKSEQNQWKDRLREGKKLKAWVIEEEKEEQNVGLLLLRF